MKCPNNECSNEVPIDVTCSECNKKELEKLDIEKRIADKKINKLVEEIGSSY